MTGLYWGMETPGLTLALNMMELLRYAITVLCLLFAQAAVFGVIAFGYVAAAIAVTLGPIFIPFFIVPGLEWLFWGWFKSLIQYAFYPVVANAYLFVFGNLLIHFVDAHAPPYGGAWVAILFFPLVMMLIAFTYGILKIPSLVNSLFTGRSGEMVRPVLERKFMQNPAIPDQDFAAARRHYVERYGHLAVMNTILKIVVLALCAVAGGLITLNVKAYNAFHHLRPLVIRINDVGRAEAVSYGSLEYQAQEAEIKYFLAQFVHGYYGRVRATFREAYPRSLYFLDGRLADATIDSNKKNNTIENFFAGQPDQVEIQVKNVAIEDLRKAPYKATVEFEKVFYSPLDHAEIRRERYVARFVFVIKQPVPNALIPVNPLGLTITYFREDQAFEAQRP